MRTNKIIAVVLATAVATLMTACSGADESNNEVSTSESTTSSAIKTTSADKDTTTATTTTAADITAPITDVSDADMVKVYYGWGGSEDEAKYTAEIFCPEGAVFSENTLENYAEDGSVMTATVDDEVNEYSASSVTHWHRDAYSSEPTAYPIIAQLYFDGEIDAETAAENSGCSQKVTPLGFKWNGYDVILIETTYTFMDYGEQTDVFVGVEYDLDYWKAEEGTGTISDLTTKALFGFDVYSYGWDDLTQDQCAWIAGELFGVDSGVTDPFTASSEDASEEVADIDTTDLLGTWIDLTSDWEDTYFFDNGGYGSYTSGFEYTFTYSIEGNVLTVFYAEDDIDVFTATLDGNTLILVDEFSYEQRFSKATEEAPADENKADTEEENEEDTISYADTILGTWTENDTGYYETFTFYADGTGHYSYEAEGGSYECGFTYEFFRSDYIDIYYDDGDVGGFQIVIDGDTMTIRNEYVWDLPYTRQ